MRSTEIQPPEPCEYSGSSVWSFFERGRFENTNSKSSSIKIVMTKMRRIATALQMTTQIKNGESGSTSDEVSQLDIQEDDEEATSDQEEESDDSVEAIAKKFQEAQDEFRKKVRSASPEEREELYGNRPTAEPYIPEMEKIASENPKTELAESACLWLVRNGRGFPEVADKAFETLLNDFIESERLHDICLSMRYAKPSPQVAERLDALINKSPHDLVKAKATFTKACYLEETVSLKRRIGDPDVAEALGEETVGYLKDLVIERESIESLYQTVIDEYSEVEVYGDRKLGQLSESSLFGLRNLSIGCVAPDIVGADIDGKEFKLSDYRGKVVMIDFWGDW